MTRLLIGRHPARTLVRVLVIVALAFLVFGYVLLPVRARGPSMMPTIDEGRLLFVNTLAYRWFEPQRGDVVAIRMAGWHLVYVKRVVGLPGDRLAIAGGIVLVDGQPLAEPYVHRRAAWNVAETVLGRDEYFAIGDNRGMDQRQHDFGIAKRARIIGKVLF